MSLWNHVCNHISYRSDDGEFWFLPSETLARGAGDCDCSANLLTSMLRAAGFDAYTVVGTYRGLGHAWVELDGEILETTFTYAHQVPDLQAYRPFAMFNEQELIELWPGSLGELLTMHSRDEVSKLGLMARASREAGW